MRKSRWPSACCGRGCSWLVQAAFRKGGGCLLRNSEHSSPALQAAALHDLVRNTYNLQYFFTNQHRNRIAILTIGKPTPSWQSPRLRVQGPPQLRQSSLDFQIAVLVLAMQLRTLKSGVCAAMSTNPTDTKSRERYAKVLPLGHFAAVVKALPAPEIKE